MKQLTILHNRLARLRRRRQWFRRATAASAIAIAVLGALAVVFALDWSFERNQDISQRLALVALAIGAVGWATRQFALPWLGKREDELEMALLVQRHTGIDSDLVAALQFESPEAPQWGSAQLETAVIQRVATGQRKLPVMAALPRQPLMNQVVILTALTVVWVMLGVLIPNHVSVFLNRLMFGSRHYPSRTQIVGLKVNGAEVDLSSTTVAPVHVSYGRPVSFEVTTTGVSPESRYVELVAVDGGNKAVVNLDPPSEEQDPGASPVYQGKYARLVQAAQFQVYMGDAWTDRLTLDVTPLPVIEVQPEVVPPAYARKDGQEIQQFPRGTGQFAVVEGSEVRLKVHSDRPLKGVDLTIEETTIAMVRESVELDADGNPCGELWAPATAGTPLASVTEPTRYSIQVKDVEDQELERPVEGCIHIEPDLPPRVAAVTKTPFVLPSAQPTIYFGATDDHAVGRVWLTWEIVRNPTALAAEAAKEKPEASPDHPAASPEKPAAAPKPSEKSPAPQDKSNSTTPHEPSAAADTGAASKDKTVLSEDKAEKPVAAPAEFELYRIGASDAPQATVEDAYALDLARFGLARGDSLRVTVHATDYRGPREGKSARGEPLVFQVTDEQGIMSSMLEGDQKSARELETIIKNLLGIGGESR